MGGWATYPSEKWWSQLGRFYIPNIIANLPDTLQQIKKSLLVKVDIPIDTKRLVRISLYPSKIDLDFSGTLW